MIQCNFATLLGVEPAALSRWYWAGFTDAYEWVELPNVAGMGTWGGGGALASKPYVASGAYVNRMSNYCGPCRYDVKQRTGPDACPTPRERIPSGVTPARESALGHPRREQRTG